MGGPSCAIFNDISESFHAISGFVVGIDPSLAASDFFALFSKVHCTKSAVYLLTTYLWSHDLTHLMKSHSDRNPEGAKQFSVF